MAVSYTLSLVSVQLISSPLNIKTIRKTKVTAVSLFTLSLVQTPYFLSVQDVVVSRTSHKQSVIICNQSLFILTHFKVPFAFNQSDASIS